MPVRHNDPCPGIWADHEVTLKHEPLEDKLALTVAGQTAFTVDGVATVTFQAPYCTSFDVAVTGVSVATVAQYVVCVDRL